MATPIETYISECLQVIEDSEFNGEKLPENFSVPHDKMKEILRLAQLGINSENPKFVKGTRAKVIDNISHHEFEINEIVFLCDYGDPYLDWDSGWWCKSETRNSKWFLTEAELLLLPNNAVE